MECWRQHGGHISTGSLGCFSPPCPHSVVLNILCLFISVLLYIFPRQTSKCSWSFNEKGQSGISHLPSSCAQYTLKHRNTLLQSFRLQWSPSLWAVARPISKSFWSTSRPPLKTWLKLQYFRHMCLLQLTVLHGIKHEKFDQTCHANRKQMASNQTRICLFAHS